MFSLSVHLIGQDVFNFVFIQELFAIIVSTLDTLVLDSHLRNFSVDVLSLAFDTYDVAACQDSKSLVLRRHFVTNFAPQPFLLCLPISFLFFKSLSLQACFFFS
jgi:hypothetical protein